MVCQFEQKCRDRNFVHLDRVHAIKGRMDDTSKPYDASLLVYALLVSLLCGLIKGVVGFAMPTILISGLSTFLSPELALAGLILPTLITNGMQAFRQGLAGRVASIVRFRAFMFVGCNGPAGRAQLVRVLPSSVMFMIIGVSVVGLCADATLGLAA